MSGRGGTRRRDLPVVDRILDSALEEFAEKGYAGATTKEIARKAKVNEVTLFRRVGSKKALFAAVLSERFPLAKIAEEVSLDGDVPVDELLRRNARAVLSILRSNKHFFMMILGDAWRAPRTRSIVSRHGTEKGIGFVTDIMQGLMEEGRIRRMDPDLAARALVGMIQSYFLTRDLLAGAPPDPEEDERILNGFVEVFLDGVGREGDHGRTC